MKAEVYALYLENIPLNLLSPPVWTAYKMVALPLRVETRRELNVATQA